MVKYLLIRVARVVLLLLLGTTVNAGDVENADRAKAVLAVAKAKGPALVVAPKPRPAPKDYPTGYKAATVEQLPLVVFVGCDAVPVDGAIACKCDAPSFGAAKAPAVVVGYPVGDRLMLDATLAGEPVPDAVKRAIAAAAKKIDAPPARPMPAPKPLDWQIRRDEPDEPAGSRRTASPCPCGATCPCGPDSCPSTCPTSKPVAEVRAASPSVTYREVWYTDGRRTWRELVPNANSAGCPNGRCPSQR